MLKPSARIFPLGTVLEGETADYNPNNFYIDGVWEQTQKGMVSVGLDNSQTEFNSIGKIGGSKTHTLTVDELANHNHSLSNIGTTTLMNTGSNYGTYIGAGTKYTENTGGNAPHNNLQPYKVVYKWKLISYSN